MKKIIELEKRYLLPVYRRFPLIIEKTKGKYVWDIHKKRYLDFFSGISVLNLGHSYPAVVHAIKKQVDKYLHISNYYYSQVQVELASLLVKKSFPSVVFFSNSGAEANECAIKIARKYNPNKYEIITFTNCFHGRTLATLSATNQKRIKDGFSPFLKGFKIARFNDILSVKRLISSKTSAVMVEPIQGEGGVNVADKRFFKGLYKLCKEKSILFILDEIQTGLGRTGRLFAYEHYGVTPDILTLAKSLGGGLPLGATLIANHLRHTFKYSEHGSTFGGNPLSCTAGIAVLKSLNKNVLRKVNMIGEYFMEKLNKLKDRFPWVIKDVKGKGLMIGVELNMRVEPVVNKLFEKGILINGMRENVIRFLPPFVINKKDIDFVVDVLEEVFSNEEES